MLSSTGAWSQIWRWELALPNAAPILMQGENVLTQLRMARVIPSLNMQPGSQWLFRLDQINTPAGRIRGFTTSPGRRKNCSTRPSMPARMTVLSRSTWA